jgi:hypothetical protein
MQDLFGDSRLEDRCLSFDSIAAHLGIKRTLFIHGSVNGGCRDIKSGDFGNFRRKKSMNG